MEFTKRFQALLISLDCDGFHLRYLGGFALGEIYDAYLTAEWEDENEYEDTSGDTNAFEISMVVDTERCTLTYVETKAHNFFPETTLRVWRDLTGSIKPEFTPQMLKEIPWRIAVIAKMLGLCENGSELSPDDQNKFDMYSAQLRGGMRVATSDDEKKTH